MKTNQIKIPNNVRCQLFLIGVLYLVGMLSIYEDVIRRGRCSTGKLIVPLSACITTANVHDSKPYCGIIESFVGLLQNILADLAYDDD